MTSGQIVGKMDTQKQLNVPLHPRLAAQREGRVKLAEVLQEAKGAPFCPSKEKFHTGVLQGVGNISHTL